VCFTGSSKDFGGTIVGFIPTNPQFRVNRPDGTFFYVNAIGQTANPLSPGYLCTKLDANGNAVFELNTSSQIVYDIIANFPDEGLVRHVDIDMGSGSSFVDIQPLTPDAVLAGTGAATHDPGTNGNGSPSNEEVAAVVRAAVAGGFGLVATPTVTPSQTITPTKTITVTKTSSKVRLLTLRLVRPAHAKAYIMVKVLSPNKTAKITLALKGKNGKTIVKLTKTIKANKQVKIQSSLIKLAVKRVTLTLVK
jgi:hypothetical protein